MLSAGKRRRRHPLPPSPCGASLALPAARTPPSAGAAAAGVLHRAPRSPRTAGVSPPARQDLQAGCPWRLALARPPRSLPRPLRAAPRIPLPRQPPPHLQNGAGTGRSSPQTGCALKKISPRSKVCTELSCAMGETGQRLAYFIYLFLHLFIATVLFKKNAFFIATVLFFLFFFF